VSITRPGNRQSPFLADHGYAWSRLNRHQLTRPYSEDEKLTRIDPSSFLHCPINLAVYISWTDGAGRRVHIHIPLHGRLLVQRTITGPIATWTRRTYFPPTANCCQKISHSGMSQHHSRPSVEPNTEAIPICHGSQVHRPRSGEIAEPPRKPA